MKAHPSAVQALKTGPSASPPDGHCHTFGHPRFRLGLHPIQSFETGLKFEHWLNCAIGPFGLYFPMLAIFKNHTKYWSSRRHVFTYMIARRE